MKNALLHSSFLRGALCLSVLCSPLYISRCYSQTQVITTPRQSPHAEVSQTIGLTDIHINYSRPAVRDREVWGQLVPYGMTAPGWGTAETAPWRAGANENTVICFSTDLTVGGDAIQAGCYGLFIEVTEGEEATLLLTSNTTSWGNYFYDPEELVASIPATMTDHAFTEWLEYEFRDLSANSATIAMNWENKTITVPVSVDLNKTVLANIREEMRGTARFSHIGPMEAASWCLQNETNYEEALGWIDESININKTYGNLVTKAGLLSKLGKEEEADKVMEEAMPLAGVFQLHGYGRQLIAQGKPKKALEVFEYNAKQNPNTWPVNYGLARGHSANGDYKKALAYMEKAEKNCPDQINLNYIQANKEKLRKGEDIN